MSKLTKDSYLVQWAFINNLNCSQTLRFKNINDLR